MPENANAVRPHRRPPPAETPAPRVPRGGICDCPPATHCGETNPSAGISLDITRAGTHQPRCGKGPQLRSQVDGRGGVSNPSSCARNSDFVRIPPGWSSRTSGAAGSGEQCHSLARSPQRRRSCGGRGLGGVRIRPLRPAPAGVQGRDRKTKHASRRCKPGRGVFFAIGATCTCPLRSPVVYQCCAKENWLRHSAGSLIERDTSPPREAASSTSQSRFAYTLPVPLS
jgi:hypothetical protein